MLWHWSRPWKRINYNMMGICQKNLFQLKSVNTNLQRSNDDYNCTLGGAKKTLPVSAEHDYTITDLLWSHNWDPVVSCAFWRDDTDFSCSEEMGVYSHFTLKSPPLLREIIFLLLNKQTHPSLLCMRGITCQVDYDVQEYQNHTGELWHISLACLGERLRFVTGNGRSPPLGVHTQVTTHKV